MKQKVTIILFTVFLSVFFISCFFSFAQEIVPLQGNPLNSPSSYLPNQPYFFNPFQSNLQNVNGSSFQWGNLGLPYLPYGSNNQNNGDSQDFLPFWMTLPPIVNKSMFIPSSNADTLDDLDSTDFARAGHDHDTNYVNTAGDTMTGNLNLKADGLVAGDDQLVLSDGKVGIATDSPNETLDVGGSIAVNGTKIINTSGEWVGSPTGLVGPQGPQGPTGPQGPKGDRGARGAPGDCECGYWIDIEQVEEDTSVGAVSYETKNLYCPSGYKAISAQWNIKGDHLFDLTVKQSIANHELWDFDGWKIEISNANLYKVNFWWAVNCMKLKH